MEDYMADDLGIILSGVFRDIADCECDYLIDDDRIIFGITDMSELLSGVKARTGVKFDHLYSQDSGLLIGKLDEIRFELLLKLAISKWVKSK